MNDPSSALSKLWFWLNIWRILPGFLLLKIAGTKNAVHQDVSRWWKIENLDNIPEWQRFCWLMLNRREFRTLYYYRIKSWNQLLSLAIRPWLPALDSLYLYTPDIGPGLFIQHGFSTIIAAKSIGNNCWINQQVTVGFQGTERPVIGNNVTINAGAKVIGGINVGDNCIVGANAVVVKDVPPGCVVVGVPARIVRRDGVRIDEAL